MKTYEAVILAGGRAPWLIPLAGTDIRSLAKIEDKYLIEYIMDALRDSKCVNNIYVASDKEALQKLKASGLSGYIPVVCENMTLAEVGLTAATAVEEHNPENHKILFVCDDIPLLTAKAIRSFLSACEAEPEGEMYYSIVRKEVCQAQYPEGKRTYGPLADGEFTGGNVTLLTRAAIARTQDMARRLYANRKHPVKLCSLLGWWFVLKALLKFISSKDVEKRCSELMGVICKAVITEYACIGMDIDKEADWKLAHKYL